MIIEGLGLILGLLVLARAGDGFVLASARLARGFRVRPIFIGAVIVGFGTSVPELLVAGAAAARGSPQVAVGSLVGSNIANLSVILAIAAFVAPIRVDSKTVRREAPLSVAAAVLLALMLLGGLSHAKGVALVIALGAAVTILVVNARRGTAGDELGVEAAEFLPPNHRSRGAEALRAGAFLVLMLAAAELLVHSALEVASRLDLAPGFVGLSLVAIGTSTPELITAIQASRQGDPDLVAGNLLGSNLFNSLAGGAAVSLLWGGPPAAAGFSGLPVWLMVGVAFGAWAFMARGSLVNRWEAAVLLGAYVAMFPFVAR